MAPMRITYHNGRSGSAKHNDRTFNLNKAEHINQQQTDNNLYCTWLEFEGDTTERSFEEAEEIFYERHFGKGLAARNDRYIKNRHPERVKSMKEYMSARQTMPEETLIYVGCKGNSVEDPNLLTKIYSDFLDWRSKAYPQLAFLDVSFHLDEATIHIHERTVWIGHDTDGNEIPGQNKALAEMGVERPDPDKPEGRYNNAKMTFTANCRAHLQEICREYGLVIEARPKERSESGLSLIEYKARKEEAKFKEYTRQNRNLEAEKEYISAKVREADLNYRDSQKDLAEAKALRNGYLDLINSAENRVIEFMERVKLQNSDKTMKDVFLEEEKSRFEHIEIEPDEPTEPDPGPEK